MSRVEIVGEKSLLRDVLSLLEDIGIFQIEPPREEVAEEEVKRLVRARLADERTVFERLFLEDLRNKINELLSHLPEIPVRESYIEPQRIIATVSYTIDKHLAVCRELEGERSFAEREASELARYLGFLNTLEILFKDSRTPPNVDLIGLTIKNPEAVEQVRAMVSGLSGGKFKMLTVPAGDGTLSGLITIDKKLSETVSRALEHNQVPEMSYPKN